LTYGCAKQAGMCCSHINSEMDFMEVGEGV